VPGAAARCTDDRKGENLEEHSTDGEARIVQICCNPSWTASVRATLIRVVFYAPSNW
jgi:predicted RNA polymerase sigma factor